MARRVSFSEDDAGRISRTVRAYEAGNRDMSPIKFRDVGGDESPVRLGKTSILWYKNTVTDILVHEQGTPPYEQRANPDETLFGCVNKFADVAAGRWVMLAKAGNGYWYLIAAEC